jgi:hypothetical protein
MLFEDRSRHSSVNIEELMYGSEELLEDVADAVPPGTNRNEDTSPFS